MAVKPAQQLSNQDFGLELITGKDRRYLISDAEFQECAKTLQFYTNNTIDESVWICAYQAGTKKARISFSEYELQAQDLRLLKTYIVDALANGIAPTTCKGYVSQLKYLFLFLEQKGIHVERMSTGVAHMYRAWLDAEYPNDTAQKKNGIESAAVRLAGFMQRKGLLPPVPIAFPKRRKVETRNRRAPERAVMRQLDRYMFDFSKPIPTDVRCAYIIHRLLPSRNSEVRLITLDGYWIENDLMMLNLPTQKETAYHQPVYRTFAFLRTGAVFENSLFCALEEQRAFALRMQPNVKDEHKGFLMVSAAYPYRLLSTQDFNNALRSICDEIGLTGSEGNRVQVTSHMLRHVSIGNQLHFGVPIEEVQHRSGHKTADMTMGYGYAAKSDEMRTYEQLAMAAHAKLSGDGKDMKSDATPRTALPRRFEKMRKEDAWLLGDDCLCQQLTCKPQWEFCIMECDKFQPDPRYLPMAQQFCAELEQYGDKATEHQRRQLAVWRRFIERTGGM